MKLLPIVVLASASLMLAGCRSDALGPDSFLFDVVNDTDATVVLRDCGDGKCHNTVDPDIRLAPAKTAEFIGVTGSENAGVEVRAAGFRRACIPVTFPGESYADHSRQYKVSSAHSCKDATPARPLQPGHKA